jgi:hypothetical protein
MSEPFVEDQWEIKGALGQQQEWWCKVIGREPQMRRKRKKEGKESNDGVEKQSKEKKEG